MTNAQDDFCLQHSHIKILRTDHFFCPDADHPGVYQLLLRKGDNTVFQF